MRKEIFLLKKYEVNGEEKTSWNRAGVAFENKDGSFNIKLDMFPQVDFQMRDPKPRKEQAQDQSSSNVGQPNDTALTNAWDE